MRISDWSSDVCSSDLKGGPKTPTVGERVPILSRIESGAKVDPTLATVAVILPPEQADAEWAQGGGTASKAYGHLALAANPARVDRRRVVEGKSVSVRVALGVRRIIKKKILQPN